MQTQTAASVAEVPILPGLHGSRPDRWQSHWERQHKEFIRVEQADWATPSCDDWTDALDAAIRKENDKVILVGHSLGSVTSAHWAFRYGRAIAGALVVAPSDAEAATFPQGTTGFAPIPLCRFPFPRILVVSTEDPYISFERNRELAAAWGSKLIAIGSRGHIGTAEGFGPWPQGLTYLTCLRRPGTERSAADRVSRVYAPATGRTLA